MKRATASRMIAIFLSLSLATACGGPKQTQAPTMDPAVVLTAAASTAQVRMTELAGSKPSPTPVTPTVQLSPTVTALVTTTVSPTLSLTASPAAGGTDQAEFISDVTVPDGTVFRQGQAFTKTWRLKNTGTSTWTSAYSVVYVSGNQMGGPASAPLVADVPPGQTADVSVNMVAPNASGSYFGFWMLRNPSQRNFGVGPGGDQPFYVQINVQGGQGTPGPTAPSVPGGKFVTDVGLAVDNASFEGDCPHSFNFIAKFTLTRPSTVSYRLEAETGFPITLPAPFNGAMDAGDYTLSYALEFSDSLDGTAQFHVTAPENVVSNTVHFTLDCR